MGKKKVPSGCRSWIQYEEYKERMAKEDPCPCCGTGGIIIKKGPFEPFFGCSRYPQCIFHESIVAHDYRLHPENYSASVFYASSYHRHYYHSNRSES
jgi:hypothetical protein